MKKLLVLTALILFSGFTFSQTLEKGNNIGIHILTITPNPDVTFNQYMDFFVNKWIPKFEESFPGLKLYIAKGNRGEHDNYFALFFVYDSEETRDKFWPEDELTSDFGTECMEKLAPTYQELQRLGTWTSVLTDWVIQ